MQEKDRDEASTFVWSENVRCTNIHYYALLRTIMGIQSSESGSRLWSIMCLIRDPTGEHADVVFQVPSNAFGCMVIDGAYRMTE